MRMKKILLGLMVLSLASIAFADGVRIDWQINYGMYDHNAPNVTDDPSSYTLLDTYSVTWQLIYAGADNAIDVPDTSLGGAGIADDYVTDDDVVWATRTIAIGGGTAPQDSTVWDHWMLWDGVNGDTVYRNYTWGATAGSVYQRIFEGTPAALSWYFDGGLMAFGTGFNASNEHLSPDYLRDGTGSSGVKPGDQFSGVPEPATMSLLGLGALVMAIRRRRS
jgi:hypothetical protein